ncbi:acyl-CoA desaturase [Exilibacterium tricleocarpae]|uniref:Acyl-CoA desaturase n=1 Tax=Exilibacterium tricleocarpae TaxID=2591008 RepID=A0A545T0E6_9GAMM|nr:acyl-CoA desaturase [Exilibacterium tricleocarpae]TQV70671.1 acyl-CoA desaturase [Exilibacterium tricleocarpae]
MMEPVYRVEDKGANPVEGYIAYDFPKLLWNLGMITSAVVFAPLTFSAASFVLFLVLTYVLLLIGHSAGMHRMMIHRTYECHPIVEKLLIYIGVLVGMSGPYGIIKIHDLRDWAQRNEKCHDFFSHKRSYFVDIWWQLTSKFMFRYPPSVNIEAKYSTDHFYQWLESTWRFHQVGLAAVLYFFGGWAFVVWGVFVRVSVSIVGHWSVTYFCHNPGPGIWRVKNTAVQASNIPGLGVITYGECWHNNHHAFPESARIGIEPGQCDPAWRFIECLSFFGLAKNIGKPRDLELRDDLQKIS